MIIRSLGWRTMTVLDHAPPDTPLTLPPAPLPLSFTLDTLPPEEPYRVHRMTAPDGSTHTLVVLADGMVCGRLEHAYTHHLTGPLRPIIWRYVLQAPDPLLGGRSTGARSSYWWTPDTPVTLAHVLWCETHGITEPWRHGRAAGPHLGPSRA